MVLYMTQSLLHAAFSLADSILAVWSLQEHSIACNVSSNLYMPFKNEEVILKEKGA